MASGRDGWQLPARDLHFRLAQRLGREFQVWRDSGREVGVLDFETNLAVIRQAIVFVAIVSPWLGVIRTRHTRALPSFCKRLRYPPPTAVQRVFQVVKVPVPPE